jgi:hypothetical protein
MAMKFTELHKRKAERLLAATRKAARPGMLDAASAPDRRERRRLDQAAGLVPFAVKLNRDLVAQVRAHAERSGEPLNDAVAALLRAGLAQSGAR